MEQKPKCSVCGGDHADIPITAEWGGMKHAGRGCPLAFTDLEKRGAAEGTPMKAAVAKPQVIK